MEFNNSDAQKLLASRASDLLRQAERGELVCGNFLTPHEAVCVLSFVRESRAEERVFLFGGYNDAERKRLFVLPSYLSDLDGDAMRKAKDYFADELSLAIKAIKIQGSGYRELSHRDYLGSLLSLGIERNAIGDIVVVDSHSAIVFCTDKIFDYLISGVERIASDKVMLSPFSPDESFCAKRDFLPIRDTVASERLDCVVGALTNLSREKAQTLIRSGLCEVNYLEELRVDVTVKAPAIITLRGYGKYRLIEFDGETKRARLRLVAEKYV